MYLYMIVNEYISQASRKEAESEAAEVQEDIERRRRELASHEVRTCPPCLARGASLPIWGYTPV